MGTLRDLTVADLWRLALRYRPVVLTIAAIVVIAVVVPGRTSSAPASPSAATSREVEAAPQQPPSSPTATAAPTTALTSPLPTIAFRPPAAVGPVASVPFTPSTGSTTPLADRDDDDPPQPLTMRSSGWASQGAGTPLATVGVPEGTLPVGTRLGQVDKASFVRLDGTATSLVLAEDPAGSRAGVGEASVQACAVEAADAAWVEADAMSFDDAPDWDPNACVDGVRTDDGTWRFDLASFASRTGDAGFALVPTADAPLDFQVTFSN